MQRAAIEDLVRSQGGSARKPLRIFHDTTEFMDLNQGDVMVLTETPYLILRNEKEAGYGIEDEPKYWVKRAVDLTTGRKKIVKLVFFENFTVKIGDIEVPFYRSPQKEARILEITKERPDFMHGFSAEDAKGNLVRVIEFIEGLSLNREIGNLPMTHEDYFYNELPKWLSPLWNCYKSLICLHGSGLVHGDIRWDHIFIDRESGNWRWIDFDYDYNFPENPFSIDLFGMGKVLSYVIAKGPLFYSDIRNDQQFASQLSSLVQEDFSLLEQQKIMNLKKLFPYIPDRLNNILLHFSGHTHVFYERINDLLEDLGSAILEIAPSPVKSL